MVLLLLLLLLVVVVVMMMIIIIIIQFLLILFSWDYLPINWIPRKAEMNNSWTYTGSSPYAFEAGAGI